MTESAGLSFVVRPLECKSLDGAFRVHLPLEAFEQLNFNLGDICQISENGAIRGYGLAWRATDRMGNAPKVKPARMSDYLKTVLDVKDGSNVTISRAAGHICPAAKITLSDVTPADYGQTDDHSSEGNRWIYWCGAELALREAIAIGTIFDVYVKKGLRRRFRISNIESEDSSAGSSTSTALHCFGDNTEITISADSVELNEPFESIGDRPLVTTDRIGGLLDQLHALNVQMTAILKQTRDSFDNRPNRAILVHGYEGTGKSLILNQLETAGFRKTSRITKSMLVEPAVAKNQAIIKSTFEAARTAQPSLILLDDLDKLIPKGNGTYTEVLSEALSNLADSQVFVVAACRSPGDLDSTLLARDCFPIEIELPTPDIRARQEILCALLKDDPSQDSQMSQNSQMLHSIALRTHGFTGRDLGRLCETAGRNRYNRLSEERNDRLWRQLVASANGHEADTAANGNGSSDAAIADNESDETHLGPKERTQEDWDRALDKTRPSALREISFEKPAIKWSDIGGSQAMKDRFDEIIGWPIHHPEMSKRHGIVPKKGILLYGPPGCSKTLTAQAVASTYDLNFIAVQGAELISMYVGESERAVREIFRKARAASPCVVFFDEIDSIASERDSGGTKGLNVLTTLLTEMDGFNSLSNVLVLAATNKPQALDAAIMRPGRFDSHVYLGPPSPEARREIFALSTRGLDVGDDVNFDELAEKTEGYTGAEVVQICNLAKDDSFRREFASGGTLRDLTMVDFVHAIENTAPSVRKETLEAYEKFGRPSQRP